MKKNSIPLKGSRLCEYALGLLQKHLSFYILPFKISFQKVGVQKVAAIYEDALMCITLQNTFRNGRLCFGPSQSVGEAWPQQSSENYKPLKMMSLEINLSFNFLKAYKISAYNYQN